MLFPLQQFVFYLRNPTHDYYGAYVFWFQAIQPSSSFYYFTLLFWWEKISIKSVLLQKYYESNEKNTFSKIINQNI